MNPRLLSLKRLPALLAALCVVLPCAASLRAKDRRLEKFYADIVAMPNGDVDVTEHITFRFIGGPWQGIYRDIPVEYVGPKGMNYSLFLDLKGITDENGNPLRYETSRERQNRRIKIYSPHADNTTRTISIEYVVSDALRFFEDHDELYWNVTGDEWPIPIESAGAHIVFPDSATDLRANVFTGSFRSTGHDATVQINGNGVDVQTKGPLGIHEGLTVAVAVDKGVFKEPSAAARIWRELRSNWPLVIPIFAFLGMFRLWWAKGRDPR